MIDEAGLHRSLGSLVHVLTRHSRLPEALQALVEQVSAALEVRGAGVALTRGPGLRFITATDPVVAAVESAQRAARAGPAYEASGSGEPVAVPDLHACARRWPAFVETALAHGIVAVSAIPLRNAETVGVCDLYAGRAKDWTADELEVAALFAELATCYVVAQAENERERRTVAQLEQALDSRVVIEQAKGVIAAERHVTVDEAFAVLRRYANDRNEKLRAVADAVVHHGLRP